MQKFRIQYQFEDKGPENNVDSSVKSRQIIKIKMAAKIQDGCQFPAFCRITPDKFCTIEHKIVIFASMNTFACMSNRIKIQ